MSTNAITVDQIIKQFPENLKFVSGSQKAQCNKISNATAPQPHSLVFVTNPDQLQIAISNDCSIIVCLEKSMPASVKIKPEQCLISTTQIPMAMAKILPLFDLKTSHFQPGIASTAKIHSSAILGKNVHIGDFVFIGEGAQIGDESILNSHVVIQANATIGKNTYLQPHVVIGFDCVVGDRCEINSFTILGSEGFGFATDLLGNHLKIPQIGIVVLENDVEIGANCSIDRATLSETRICAGTKLDNQIHIAHNCIIGKNSRITAGFKMAGSSAIGENFLCGGNVLITDHVRLCDNVTLAGNSVVTKDISEPGAYGGYPLEPLRDALKTIANKSQLTKMRKQIALLVKHLGLNTQEDS